MRRSWTGKLKVDAARNLVARRAGSEVGLVLQLHLPPENEIVTYDDDDVTEQLAATVAKACFLAERLRLELEDQIDRADPDRAVSYARMTTHSLQLDQALSMALSSSLKLNEAAWSTGLET